MAKDVKSADNVSELKCPTPYGYGMKPVGFKPQGYEGKRSCLLLERRAMTGDFL